MNCTVFQSEIIVVVVLDKFKSDALESHLELASLTREVSPEYDVSSCTASKNPMCD